MYSRSPKCFCARSRERRGSLRGVSTFTCFCPRAIERGFIEFRVWVKKICQKQKTKRSVDTWKELIAKRAHNDASASSTLSFCRSRSLYIFFLEKEKTFARRKREDFRAEKSFGKSFSLPLVCSLSVRSSFVHKDRLHALEGEGSPFVVVFKPPLVL